MVILKYDWHTSLSGKNVQHHVSGAPSKYLRNLSIASLSYVAWVGLHFCDSKGRAVTWPTPLYPDKPRTKVPRVPSPPPEWEDQYAAYMPKPCPEATSEKLEQHVVIVLRNIIARDSNQRLRAEDFTAIKEALQRAVRELVAEEADSGAAAG